MPPANRSIWLWMGLGCLSSIAIRLVIYQLEQVSTMTEVGKTKRKPQPRIIDQETEDALKLDTLRTLVDDSNYDLRGVAAKILCQRCTSGPAFELLLEDVASPNPQVRDKALVTLRYLALSEAGAQIDSAPTLRAVVIALTHILRDPSRTASSQRFPPERNALVIIIRFLHWNISAALDAGIIRQWLAHYPLGGTTPAERRAAIKRLSTNFSDDFLLSEVVSVLEDSAVARKQMRLAGLTGSAIDEDSDGEYSVRSGTRSAPDFIIPTRRLREESLEEQRLRRRRREAMVLSDGLEPLGRADIIQRGDGVDIREEDVERELGELMDQIRIEEDRRQSSWWSSWIPWGSE
ncbi:MAG: hypothetical protein M4579_002818 [Chaenotheca gracillima]|nr:MAG: hypothetical protein M4579_002818 [Chaenotheca gracillima]